MAGRDAQSRIRRSRKGAQKGGCDNGGRVYDRDQGQIGSTIRTSIVVTIESGRIPSFRPSQVE
ncbi:MULTISPECIES: hypothetical protein [unclassified Mesorhizobium]|uniref:hypothetical protein n=1 Tax=unclassified Mesorhizobium TaxID=325217 RepID=UPI003337A14C